MYKVNILKTSQFAVDANFIDDYLQIQNPPTPFAVNSSAGSVAPTATVNLYGNPPSTGNPFTYGQSGKSCRFARIGYNNALQEFFISNSSGSINVYSASPTAGTKSQWFMVQNDPQYSTYDIYRFRYPLNSKVAAFIVPGGYAAPDPLLSSRFIVAQTDNLLSFEYWPGGTSITIYDTILGVGVSEIPEVLNYAGTQYVFFPKYSI